MLALNLRRASRQLGGMNAHTAGKLVLGAGLLSLSGSVLVMCVRGLEAGSAIAGVLSLALVVLAQALGHQDRPVPAPPLPPALPPELMPMVVRGTTIEDSGVLTTRMYGFEMVRAPAYRVRTTVAGCDVTTPHHEHLQVGQKWNHRVTSPTALVFPLVFRFEGMTERDKPFVQEVTINR